MNSEQVLEKDESYRGVIYSVFQRPMLKANNEGQAVALVAAHPGAGTTYVTDRLVRSLNAGGAASARGVDCRELAQGKLPDLESYRTFQPLKTDVENWRSSRSLREQYLRRLKMLHGSVLLDCPSLRESADILGLAPLVDGVLLVVEANKTTKGQIDLLERAIEGAGGKILGHLLNKRTYPLPEWAHRQLEAWGM